MRSGFVLMRASVVAGALAAVPHPAPAQSPPPAPYSLPWQLRSVSAGSVVRIDETVALFESPSTRNSGFTWVTSLLVSIRLTPHIAPVARIAWVSNDPPYPQSSGTAVSNPLLGITYAEASGPWRGAAFLAGTLPVGQGGGSNPDAAKAAAVSRGIPARSGMDNALYAVNFWTAIAGIGLAYVDRNLTAQGEATLLRLTKARGPQSEDGARTNFTTGVHLGYFPLPRVSVGGELRVQRWLTDAAPVRRDPTARQTVTLALGVRAYVKLADKRWLRPGIAYARPLDDPLARESYDMIQLDIPLAF